MSPAFLVYELFAPSKILFQGPQPLQCLISSLNFINTFTNISLPHLRSILTLSSEGQELWFDLQINHVPKPVFDVRGWIVIRAITLERSKIE